MNSVYAPPAFFVSLTKWVTVITGLETASALCSNAILSFNFAASSSLSCILFSVSRAISRIASCFAATCADDGLAQDAANGLYRRIYPYIFLPCIGYALWPPICSLRSFAVAPSWRLAPLRIAFFPYRRLMSINASWTLFSLASSSSSFLICCSCAS